MMPECVLASRHFMCKLNTNELKSGQSLSYMCYWEIGSIHECMEGGVVADVPRRVSIDYMN